MFELKIKDRSQSLAILASNYALKRAVDKFIVPVIIWATVMRPLEFIISKIKNLINKRSLNTRLRVIGASVKIARFFQTMDKNKRNILFAIYDVNKYLIALKIRELCVNSVILPRMLSISNSCPNLISSSTVNKVFDPKESLFSKTYSILMIIILRTMKDQIITGMSEVASKLICIIMERRGRNNSTRIV